MAWPRAMSRGSPLMPLHTAPTPRPIVSPVCVPEVQPSIAQAMPPNSSVTSSHRTARSHGDAVDGSDAWT